MKRYVFEQKFYLDKSQNSSLQNICHVTGTPMSELVRNLVVNAIAMRSGDCAVCADGRPCIAPQIRLADTSNVKITA